MNAAMTAVMAIGMLHREREIAASPAAMLRHINTTLHAKTDKRLFVAMLVASFENQPRSMVFANAGQSLPIRLRRGELTSLTGRGERLPLGVRERVEYRGLLGGPSAGGHSGVHQRWGDGCAKGRRHRSLMMTVSAGSFARSRRNCLPGRCVQTIVAAVKEVTGGGQLHDDVTVVVAKVRSPTPEGLTDGVRRRRSRACHATG